MKRPYRTLEHTADIRLRIFGRTLRRLFENAVYALTDTLTDVKKVQTLKSLRLRIRGMSRDHLLVLLLKEILFLFDTKRFLARRLVIRKLDGKILLATVEGDRLKAHRLKTEIKAVTYHGLRVERRRGRWVAEIVMDV